MPILMGTIDPKKRYFDSCLDMIPSPNSRVANILDTKNNNGTLVVAPVFTRVVGKHRKNNIPVFRIEPWHNTPYLNVFFPANIGIQKIEEDNFIPAPMDISSESSVIKSRPVRTNRGSTDYLISRP